MAKTKSIEKDKSPTLTTKIVKRQKLKKRDANATVAQQENVTLEVSEAAKQNIEMQKSALPKTKSVAMTMEQVEDKYPVLKDEKLVERFLSVPMNNNQKGRVRQLLRDKLKDTSNILLPDVIYSKIQLILKGSVNLTDTDLRKIRILYNMLKTAVQNYNKADESKKVKRVPVKNEPSPVEDKDENENVDVDKGKKEKKERPVQKMKGKKRYVVFIGNLPIDIDREKIMGHFSELSDEIADVRVPKLHEGKKSAIAYLELKNEHSYERALSKHHSMLGTKRINVLYTTQKNGKISKAEAKSKSAKLQALQKSGRLIGSVPVKRKRSHRRMRMKQAQAKEAQNS